MTREQERAIQHIKTRADVWAVQEIENALTYDISKDSEEQDPCDTYTEGYFKGYDDGVERKLEDFCEDAISREDAIKCVESHEYTMKAAAELRTLPSVTPKPTMQERIEKEYLLESIREDLEKLQAENDELRKQIEPCEDAISRADAIDQMEQSYNILDATDRIKALPPVTPKSTSYCGEEMVEK